MSFFYSSLGKGGEHEWMGDGFCDDINNNKFCNFDNGDCCGSNVKKHFCLNCTCMGMLPVYHSPLVKPLVYSLKGSVFNMFLLQYPFKGSFINVNIQKEWNSSKTFSYLLTISCKLNLLLNIPFDRF